MLMSMDILAEELQDLILFTSIRADSGLTLQNIRFPGTDDPCLFREFVYICSTPPDPLPAGSNLILTDPISREEIPDTVSALVVRPDTPSEVLYNRLFDVARKYDEWYLALHRLLEQNAPYKDFLTISEDIFHSGITLLDWNHNTIAVTDTEMPDCPLWDAIQHGYGYEYRYIIEHSSPKISMLSSMKTMSQNWSNIDKRYLYNVPLFVNGSSVYGIGLHKKTDPEIPYGKATAQLLELFADIMLRRLAPEYNTSHNPDTLFDIFIQDVIQGTQAHPDEVNAQNNFMTFDPKDNLLLAVISFPKITYRSDILRIYARELEAILEDSYCSINSSNILWIMNVKENTHYALLPLSLRTMIESWLRKRQAICSLSPSFSSLSLLQIRYRQADVTKKLGLALDGADNVLYDYFDHLHLHIVAGATAAIDITTLVHPVLQLLINYDKTHNSTYYETFKQYLLNYSDMTFNEIADMMHVHRNTLHYRLDKIQDIIQCDYERAEVRRPLLWSIYCTDQFPRLFASYEELSR